MAAARFLVRGRVQGVRFRAATRDEALRLGLSGHARNLADGSVEVLALGDAAAIDALETWLWQGPVQARVDRLSRQGVSSDSVPASGFGVA